MQSNLFERLWALMKEDVEDAQVLLYACSIAGSLAYDNGTQRRDLALQQRLAQGCPSPRGGLLLLSKRKSPIVLCSRSLHATIA